MSILRAILLLTLMAGAFLAAVEHVDVHAQATGVGTPSLLPAPIVFASRQIPEQGTIYWDKPRDMPGAGPHSRFRVAAPGKLMILTPGGDLRTLIDGSNPQAASMHLIDVNAPDVSYDSQRILFAGFPAHAFGPGDDLPARSPNGWRIYMINVDGSGLRQITFPGPELDMSQFGDGGSQLAGSDDTDPVWLPDGRIMFASTRWPGIAHYSGVRTSNLYVVNQDGSGLHRITAEKNGAERPLVDPLTGKVVYARWWRNHRFPVNDMTTIEKPGGGYHQKDGLTEDRYKHVGGPDFLFRNQWHAAIINPDGTGLRMFSQIHHGDEASHYYGGSFRKDGNLVANYFPMANMTEAGGFGGIRLFPRNANYYLPIVGVTKIAGAESLNLDPYPSFGVTAGPYFAEPAALPDNRIVVSRAVDINQDYGLYVINVDGGGLRLIYDNPGTTELRARLVQSRPLPPIISDTVPAVDSLLPPREGGPYDVDGTFVFDALNVYGNGPIDTIPMSAPPVGSADKIRFFLDMQRTSPGSFPHLDWPILLGEIRIAADGSVRDPAAPANLPLFEQIRSKDGTVPLTPGGLRGAAHVAGMNFGRPREVARCIGCHPGHTTIPVPENDEDAKWSNLAPGALVRVSTTRDPDANVGLIDRRVMNGSTGDYWSSALGQSRDQWVELVFPEPVTVRTVRLYNPRHGGDAVSTVQVEAATVRLFRKEGVIVPSATQSVSSLTTSGVDVNFPDTPAQVVRVSIDSVSGTFFSQPVAALAEIEVISRGREPDSLPARSRSAQR